MPFYEYRCSEADCGHEFEMMLSMSRCDEPQSCPQCGHGPAKKLISQSSVIFKGDDWASKNDRVARQMREKNARLDKRQTERKKEAPVSTLAPNVDGERVSSWADAQKLAASKGKDASSYDSKVKAEQTAKK